MKFPIVSLRTAVVTLAFSITVTPSLQAQAPITVGNLVAVRVGNGAAALTSAASATFLEEMTTTGAPVQTLPMPTAVSGANLASVNSGSATSEGFLNQSIDGRYLTLGGYNAAPGTLTIANTATTGATPVVRVLARVDVSSGAIDTSTSTTAFSGTFFTAANIRSVASFAGSDFYASGAITGLQYSAGLGATSTTTIETAPTNTRVAQITFGQLYTSSASGAFLGVCTVGSGLPTTSGQPTTLLSGMGANGLGSPSVYDYWFADPSTCYVADDRPLISGGGIQKWTFNGTAWSLAYTLGVNAVLGARAVTGTSAGGTNYLFAVASSTGGAAGVTTIVSITDTGAGSAFTLLATSPTNTAYRGIRLIRPVTSVTAFGAGCAGPFGAPVLAATTTPAVASLPFFGNSAFSVTVTNADPGAILALFGSIGTDPSGSNSIGLAYGNCPIYLDINSALALMNAGLFPIYGAADGTGTGMIGLPIPYAPGFAGTHVGLQVLTLPGGNPSALTNGLDLLLND